MFAFYIMHFFVNAFFDYLHPIPLLFMVLQMRTCTSKEYALVYPFVIGSFNVWMCKRSGKTRSYMNTSTCSRNMHSDLLNEGNDCSTFRHFIFIGSVVSQTHIYADQVFERVNRHTIASFAICSYLLLSEMRSIWIGSCTKFDRMKPHITGMKKRKKSL